MDLSGSSHIPCENEIIKHLSSISDGRIPDTFFCSLLDSDSFHSVTHSNRFQNLLFEIFGSLSAGPPVNFDRIRAEIPENDMVASVQNVDSGVAVEHTGHWNVLRNNDGWELIRIYTGSSDIVVRFEELACDVLEEFCEECREFRLIILRGMGPRVFMDHDRAILYADLLAMADEIYLKYCLRRELHLWKYPSSNLKDAIMDSLKWVRSIGRSLDIFFETLSIVYGVECSTGSDDDTIADSIISRFYSQGTDRKIAGRIHYCPDETGQPWIIMDSQVRYPLSTKIPDIDCLNSVRKWTSRGLDIIHEMIRARSLGENVLLIGDAGTGKDWLAMMYGRIMGEDPIVVSLSEDMEGQELIASRGLEAGLTVWEYSQIVNAYVNGRIIILDEVNKTRPGVCAILNEIMEAPELEMPDGSWVSRCEGFQIIATMNEAGEEYGGYDIDPDFRDRFATLIQVDELDKNQRIEFLRKVSHSIVPRKFIEDLISLQDTINNSGQVWRKMSLRVLERIIEARRRYPAESLASLISSEYMIGNWEKGHGFVNSEVQGFATDMERNFRSSILFSFRRGQNVRDPSGQRELRVVLVEGRVWLCCKCPDGIQAEPLSGPIHPVSTVNVSTDQNMILAIAGSQIWVWYTVDGVIWIAEGIDLSDPASPQCSGSTTDLSNPINIGSQTASTLPAPILKNSSLVSGSIRIPAGNESDDCPGPVYGYYEKETPTGNRILHQVLLGLSMDRNVLLVGPVGTGKSWLSKAVFRMLEKKVEHMSLHEGTTVQDLMVWQKTVRVKDELSLELELSPLVRAAVEGRPCIVDEVNRASAGVLAVLNHILQFREVILPKRIQIDGKLTDRLRVRQGFNLIMTMNPPQQHLEVNRMLADFMDRMYCVRVDHLPPDEELGMLKMIWEHAGGLVDGSVERDLEILVRIASETRKEAEEYIRPISTRALERMVHFRQKYPDHQWADILCMMTGIEGAVDQKRRQRFYGYWNDGSGCSLPQSGSCSISISDDSEEAEIGGIRWGRKNADICSRYFGGIDQNDRIIELMTKMRDMESHVLLVGEAGTGKDWLALAYGELMGEEPVVVSLSEEVEGQELIASRGLEEGITVWEYSHIVEAYERGEIIIIDEVTRTRPGVRAILNEIMESPELEMPDGRWVQRGEGFQIIATMNEVKEGYEGYELGEDFEDRFGAIIEVQELAKTEKMNFLRRVAQGRLPDTTLSQLIDFQEEVNSSSDVWRKLSLRVLERIVEMKTEYPDERIGDIILSEFMIGEWESGRGTVEKMIAALPEELAGRSDWTIGNSIEYPGSQALEMSFSDDGHILAVLDRSGSVYVSRIHPGKQMQWQKLERDSDYKDSLILSGNGDFIAVKGEYRAADIWQKCGESWKRVDVSMEHAGRISGIYPAYDGRCFFVVTYRGAVLVWTRDEHANFEGEGVLLKEEGTRIRFGSLAGDSEVFAAGDDEGTVRVWYRSREGDFSADYMESARPGDVMTAGSWSPDLQVLACAGLSGNVYVMYRKKDCSHGEWKRLEGPGQDMVFCSWSGNGDYLIAGGGRGEIFLWCRYDLVNIPGKRLEGPSGDLTQCTRSADSSTIAATGHDYKVYLWGVKSGSCEVVASELKVSDNLQRMQRIWLSENGQYLIGHSMNGGIYMWSRSVHSGWRPEYSRLSCAGECSEFLSCEYLKEHVFAADESGGLYQWTLPSRGLDVLESALENAEQESLAPEIGNDLLVSGSVSLERESREQDDKATFDYLSKQTPSNDRTLHRIMMGLALNRNILLVGPVGSGKSWIAKSVFGLLNKRIEHMSLHEGSTELDLTAWQKTERRGRDISLEMEISPLVRAAIDGRPCVIEGVNRISSGVLAVLNHALQFKEIILPKRIRIGSEMTDTIKAEEGFQLVMTAIPPGGLVDVNPFMADFMDRMFTVEVDYLPPSEEAGLLEGIWHNESNEQVDPGTGRMIRELVEMADRRRRLARQNFRRTITTRTLERVIRFRQKYPGIHWMDILGMMCGVEGAVDQEQIRVWKIGWEAKFGEQDQLLPAPLIVLHSDRNRVTIGDLTWQRMDTDVECRYIEGIDQNDRIIELMAKMRDMQSHVLLVGEAGTGKDWLALAYGELMGEEPVVVSLSEEVEGQDLIAMRGLRAGITVWEYSHIVDAYENGRIVILDEVTRARPGVRAILNEIMEAERLEMPDGRWIQRAEGFQIIATMNEVKEGYEGYELGEDFEDRFGAIVEVQELPESEKRKFLERVSRDRVNSGILDSLLKLQETVNSEETVWRRMSQRVLERIVEDIARYPDEPPEDIIHSEFMLGEWEEGYGYVVDAVESMVCSLGNVRVNGNKSKKPSPVYIDDLLVSGDVRLKVGSEPDTCPDPEYEYHDKQTPSNDRVLHRILLGISMNRNVLLIGPSGCGKSWMTRAVFRLLRTKIEHMSLHEATTVQDLTVWQKTVRRKGEMFIELELSPLVRAAVEGRPCVVDDVNRASPGVLAVLNHALQFKEIVLPRGIEVSDAGIPSGRDVRKIRAKEGFQLIMTANVPEDGSGVNQMMADFMDRMYSVDMHYLPQCEETDLMMAILGFEDRNMRNELELLVDFVNYLRESGEGPTFRSMERIVENLRTYPYQDIRLLLERELRIGFRSEEEQEMFTEFMESCNLDRALRSVYENPVSGCTWNELIYHAFDISLPVSMDDLNSYDPARWWEAGDPDDYQQARARKRYRILVKLLHMVTGLDISLNPWSKARVLDKDKPSWGCVFDRRSRMVKEVFFSPWDIIYREDEQSLYGLLFHEIFEILYRRPAAFDEEFLSKPGANALINGIGDIWINRRGMSEFPGTRKWIMALYRQSMDSGEYPALAYLQFISAVVYEWIFQERDPRVADRDVINALDSLRETFERIYSTDSEDEYISLIHRLYSCRDFQYLVEKSVEEKVRMQGIDLWAGDWKMAGGVREDLLRSAAAGMVEQERTGGKAVDENGRQLNQKELEELRRALLESVRAAREELERLDEEREQERVEAELKRAEIAREERELEGISEKEQQEYSLRYEKVSEHIKQMRERFREIYRHERGVWKRRLSRGRLDSTQLASLVAGDDRVFMKREQPERYMVRISLLVDQSASMQGEKIDHVADAVLMLLAAIQRDQRKGVQVEVVGFHDDSPMEIYLKYGEKITKKKIIRVVNQVAGTMGRNNDLQAIYYAFERIPSASKRALNLIIHFSDGDPNQQFDRDQFRDLINRNPHINVVGFGIGGEGADFVLDLYPEGQAATADNASEIPEKLSSLIQGYVRRR
ncbi:ATPase associated with various cellular activities AAA_5 [Methanosalsum zhilinae DSM 4017]|uniref:ATPase associated with various cellular activities AAA_5 n=1 Tax=Methanosalsum zhilinae (strain DSM 4017 / NBRC 107636 / OCM 62 / WeN5) TaxID=679901 RepID=F7XNB1_METZD|nr:AAA family ATPase [Methanosalsum zhilinae]AEH60071.1 ATPase associated with various cellular activities AAA_5 [Methanosalsum zhilinae DSM 4017]